MKKLLILLFLCTPPLTWAQSDSLQLIKLEAQLQESKTHIEQLEKLQKEQATQIASLEADREKASDWITWLGIPLGALSLYTLYLGFIGIKDRANKAVADVVNEKVANLAPGILRKELEQHPLSQAFNQSESLKTIPLLILSKEGKDIRFEKLLLDQRFSNIRSEKIQDFQGGKTDVQIQDFQMILFNNEQGDMKQYEMDQIIEKVKKGANYFYFQGKGERWLSDPSNIGFASTKETGIATIIWTKKVKQLC